MRGIKQADNFHQRVRSFLFIEFSVVSGNKKKIVQKEDHCHHSKMLIALRKSKKSKQTKKTISLQVKGTHLLLRAPNHMHKNALAMCAQKVLRVEQSRQSHCQKIRNSFFYDLPSHSFFGLASIFHAISFF